MRRITRLVRIFVSLIAIAASAQPLEIPAAEAGKHVGERTTVCGKVASGHYAKSSRGQPTFIDLDKPYPNPIFTIVIWGEDRNKFTNPESAYQDKRVCVTGVITEYKNTPQIVVHAPGDIKLAEHR
jgi:micrococcal nuclease